LGVLNAKNIIVTYDVLFSVFGKIGDTTVSYEADDNHYNITVVATTTGVAAKLTSNRVETYISSGEIVSGVLQPKMFKSLKKSDKKIRTKTYTFDHEKQVVMLDINTTRIKNDRSFDLKTLSIVETKREVHSHSFRKYDYYAPDDTLTLFFNTPKYLKDAHVRMKVVTAIGIHNKGIGITIPTSKREKKIRKLMKIAPSDRLYTIDVSKDILTEDDAAGELIIAMDDNEMPTSVLMEDIALFGDIRAKKISQKINNND
jgi:hypothetical protein